MPEGEYIDLDEFTALRYRVRSDGRKYIVSLRTDNWITGGIGRAFKTVLATS